MVDLKVGNTVEETRVRIEERKQVLEAERGGLRVGEDSEEKGYGDDEEEEEEEYHKLTWDECEMILEQVEACMKVLR